MKPLFDESEFDPNASFGAGSIARMNLLLEAIHQSNLIENIDDQVEDVQTMVAWEYLVAQDYLTHGVVTKVQKLITLHQTDLAGGQRGYYRDMTTTNVRVGAWVAPHYVRVRAMMGEWLWSEPNITPEEAHVRFEKIHPFVDGNGRTGRLLYYWRLMRLGRFEAKNIIRFNKRHEYYSWFE